MNLFQAGVLYDVRPSSFHDAPSPPSDRPPVAGLGLDAMQEKNTVPIESARRMKEAVENGDEPRAWRSPAGEERAPPLIPLRQGATHITLHYMPDVYSTLFFVGRAFPWPPSGLCSALPPTKMSDYYYTIYILDKIDIDVFSLSHSLSVVVVRKLYKNNGVRACLIPSRTMRLRHDIFEAAPHCSGQSNSSDNGCGGGVQWPATKHALNLHIYAHIVFHVRN